jgi:hypothetical protein
VPQMGQGRKRNLPFFIIIIYPTYLFLIEYEKNLCETTSQFQL